jgi:hypothetical protein
MGTCYMLKYFNYKHLPDHLQEISKPFSELAHKLVSSSGDRTELEHALRKLLEAKDCAVRSLVK